MKWAVSSYHYDSGRVSVLKPYTVPDETVSHSEETEHFDHYIDVFDTDIEAKRFIQEEYPDVDKAGD